jgi:hypothetical protein
MVTVAGHDRGGGLGVVTLGSTKVTSRSQQWGNRLDVSNIALLH